MSNPRIFGKRGTAPLAAPAARKAVNPVDAPAADPITWPREQDAALDEELRQWKRGRSGFRMPWRQISLTASLCFGVASLVLPHSVNEAVRGPLYALSAVSLWTGIKRKKMVPPA